MGSSVHLAAQASNEDRRPCPPRIDASRMTDGVLLRLLLIHDPALPLPCPLFSWATQRLIDTLPRAQRIGVRDRLLREAASLLPAAQSWTKAKAIREAACALRRALPAHPDTSTATGCVAASMLVWPGKILSVKQTHRVILIGPEWFGTDQR